MDYSLNKRMVTIGNRKGETAYVAALVTDAREIGFREFCALVAKNSTLSPGEVMSVLDALPDEINFLCSLGHRIDLGRMGSARPRFTAKAVSREEDFNPQEHIRDVRVEIALGAETKEIRSAVFNRVRPRNRRSRTNETNGNASGSKANDSPNTD